MSERFSVEEVVQIWDNENDGERIEFGPDRDGLGLVEIRCVNSDGSRHSSFTMVEEQAAILGKKLLEKYGPKE